MDGQSEDCPRLDGWRTDDSWPVLRYRPPALGLNERELESRRAEPLSSAGDSQPPAFSNPMGSERPAGPRTSSEDSLDTGSAPSGQPANHIPGGELGTRAGSEKFDGNSGVSLPSRSTDIDWHFDEEAWKVEAESGRSTDFPVEGGIQVVVNRLVLDGRSGCPAANVGMNENKETLWTSSLTDASFLAGVGAHMSPDVDIDVGESGVILSVGCARRRVTATADLLVYPSDGLAAHEILSAATRGKTIVAKFISLVRTGTVRLTAPGDERCGSDSVIFNAPLPDLDGAGCPGLISAEVTSFAWYPSYCQERCGDFGSVVLSNRMLIPESWTRKRLLTSWKLRMGDYNNSTGDSCESRGNVDQVVEIARVAQLPVFMRPYDYRNSPPMSVYIDETLIDVHGAGERGYLVVGRDAGVSLVSRDAVRSGVEAGWWDATYVSFSALSVSDIPPLIDTYEVWRWAEDEAWSPSDTTLGGWLSPETGDHLIRSALSCQCGPLGTASLKTLSRHAVTAAGAIPVGTSVGPPATVVLGGRTASLLDRRVWGKGTEVPSLDPERGEIVGLNTNTEPLAEITTVPPRRCESVEGSHHSGVGTTPTAADKSLLSRSEGGSRPTRSFPPDADIQGAERQHTPGSARVVACSTTGRKGIARPPDSGQPAQG